MDGMFGLVKRIIRDKNKNHENHEVIKIVRITKTLLVLKRNRYTIVYRKGYFSFLSLSPLLLLCILCRYFFHNFILNKKQVQVQQETSTTSKL